MARIVTVYTHKPQRHDVENQDLLPIDMSYIRWHKISEALARLGHQVDIATPDILKRWTKNLNDYKKGVPRRIPLSDIEWEDYDVVKTLFNIGIETLELYGGTGHPFIISKL